LPNNEKSIKVSCSLNGIKLHISAVSLSGNIYHTIYLSQTQWGDIEQNSKEAGTFIDISCSFVGNRLHVVGITNNGRILHTFRNRNGSWQPFFGDIESVAGEAGEFAAVDIF